MTAVQTVVTPVTLRGWPLPPPGGDKEARGRVLLVGGSEQTPGAVLLAAAAGLRAGAGKVQIATVASVTAAVGIAVPEALVRPLPATAAGHIAPSAAEAILELADGCDTVLLGSGFVDPGAAVDLLAALLPQLKAPVVLDALASAYLTERRDGVHHLCGRCVLTINPGELAKTLDLPPDDVEQDQGGATSRLADEAGAVVLCGGGAKTIGNAGGDRWVVQAGGPGLGVSGSGDVQAGIVAGLLARGAEPDQAAVWAAYLHGRAGDRLAGAVARVGFLAREIPDQVPHVLAELET